MRERILSVVMLLMGVLLIVGSTVSTFATSIFPFDKYLGINASVAGVAFGVRMAAASFELVSYISWLRIGRLYVTVLVVQQLVFGYFVGTIAQ